MLRFDELNSPLNVEDELITLTMKPINALESYKNVDDEANWSFGVLQMKGD